MPRKPAGAQHSDHFGQAIVAGSHGDEGHRGPADARHGATVADAQQVDGRAGVAGDGQMGEAGDDEQQQRPEPERPGAVAVDPRAQDQPHGEAADHSDADDPAEVKLGSAQQA